MKTREEALKLLAGRVPSGDAFFSIAAQALALGVGCRWAGVGSRPAGTHMVQVLALWDGDQIAEPFSFELPGSPCAEVYGENSATGHVFFPKEAAALFPNFPLLTQLGVKSYRGELFHDSAGEPVGHVFALSEEAEDDSLEVRSFFRLVAQRTGAEYNRWRAESRLEINQRMLDATRDQMVFIDRDYTYLAINASYLAATRPSGRSASWTTQDIVGRSVGEVLGEEFFSTTLKPALDRCLGGQEVSVQNWFDPPDRPRCYLQAEYRPYFNKDGLVEGIVATIRDLTHRKRNLATITRLSTHEALLAGDLERAARQVTEVAAETLEVERVGLWLLAEDGRRLDCIDLFERSQNQHSTGATLEAADAADYFRSLSERQAIDAHDALADSRTQEFAAAFLKPHKISSLLDVPIRVGGRMVGVLSHQHVGEQRFWQPVEITFAGAVASLAAQAILLQERRELEEHLYQARKMESLGVLAGGVAHDFNNLLVGILGGAELALAQLPETSDACHHLATVRESALRASDLCSQMLAYAGKGKFLVELVDLSSLAHDTARLLQPTLGPRVTLSHQCPSDLPPVEADATQLRQIVMNLLTNAAEALEGKDGVVSLRTWEGFLEDSELAHFQGVPLAPGHYVLLQVTDTGCGMDESTQARIFEPFFTTKLTGRGLGLAATLGIVRSHAGGIRISSRLGNGTTIQIALPRALEGSSHTPSPSKNESPERGEKASGRVLVVDDEEVVRLVTGGALENAGYEVLEAEDGPRGLDLFHQQAENLDLVILDVTMPGMDGEETLMHMRRHRHGVPVIVISGYSAEETIERFNAHHVAGFLHKPFRAQELLETVRRVLAATSTPTTAT